MLFFWDKSAVCGPSCYLTAVHVGPECMRHPYEVKSVTLQYLLADREAILLFRRSDTNLLRIYFKWKVFEICTLLIV